MVTLQMMQFTAVVLMLLLTVKLLFLRGRHIKSRQVRQARRLMAGGTMLLALHFALQLTMGLRLMGVTQSVMLNLAMLIPASYFFARAVLLLTSSSSVATRQNEQVLLRSLLRPLQRHGELSLTDQWTGPAVWMVTMAMLAVAALTDGISRYRLTAWLHQRGVKYTEWMAQLRVEEAKRTIAAHPDWGNDAVAQHCGFADRTVLQRTFKKIEGITPQKYMENHVEC